MLLRILGGLSIFMFGTAARVSETTRLKWSEIDLSAGTARLSGDKPKPWTRVAHLPPEVIAALANIPSNRNPDDLVFQYAGRGSVTKVWASAVKRAGVAPPNPAFVPPWLCHHEDARRVRREHDCQGRGLEDPATVLRHYGHALDDKTVTNALFGTNLTQADTKNNLSNSNIRRK